MLALLYVSFNKLLEHDIGYDIGYLEQKQNNTLINTENRSYKVVTNFHIILPCLVLESMNLKITQTRNLMKTGTGSPEASSRERTLLWPYLWLPVPITAAHSFWSTS